MQSNVVKCSVMKFSICERVNREWHWIGSDRGALASALEARWGTIYNVNVSAHGMYNVNVSANGMHNVNVYTNGM